MGGYNWEDGLSWRDSLLLREGRDRLLEEGGDEKMQVTADWAEGVAERRGGVNWEVIRRDSDTFRAGKEPAERKVDE